MAGSISGNLSRRALLAGLMSSGASVALARVPDATMRPAPRGGQPSEAIPESEALVKKAALGGAVGFAVMDLTTGAVLETRQGGKLLPPASTLKAVTALYALERLSPDHVFRTEVLATGPIVNGRIEGDLVLKGSGDPTLDTDRLGDLAVALREAGVTEVTGSFLIWRDALPMTDRIDTDQPEHVSYNPAIGGLNLNFNRVHFQWEKKRDGYDYTMHARGLRFSPGTNVATMQIVDRSAPIFDYRRAPRSDRWSVAEKALGRDGARWLPVRFPGYYAGDVFRTLARSNGIVLEAPEVVDALPEGQVVAAVESTPLVEILQGMLKYSTNLTAEAVGQTASQVGQGPVPSLTASGARMAGWAMARFGMTGLTFRDHSGLGYASSITPEAMVGILAPNPDLAPLLKRVNLSLDKARPDLPGVDVHAKTGTLNFVSSLAGFVTTASGRQLAFAIFTADTERRDAIPPEARERAPGAKAWSRRSRQLQKELIRGWVRQFGGT